MRWKEEIENKHYHGQQRIITKIALFPIHCINGDVSWLEKVNIKQEYRIDPSYHWVNLCFV